MVKNNKIIGRIEECRKLEACLEKEQAQLVVVYGRRRVGKTYLINQFFDNKFAVKVTGVYGQSRENQISNFLSVLGQKTGKKYEKCENWYSAFGYLREYIESLPVDEKKVIFIDEMPWMDNPKSDFLPSFEWFWNDYASTIDNLVLIVCGSATAWMDEKISKNKGGLFNRFTCRLYLEPFNLYEVEKYLESKDIYWSRYEIAECYMIMGGIPYYLNLLTNKMTFTQNIDSLFFEKHGTLWDEFDNLYGTLFLSSEKYITVVTALGEKKSGMTRAEIIERTGLPTGGELSKVLNNLVLSGFVRVTGFYNQKKKDSIYQLSDYYTMFYLKFIKDNLSHDDKRWSHMVDLPSKKAWAGFTFEQVCRDHTAQIKRKLGVSGVLTQESSWFCADDDDKGVSGAQIDLLIDRRDRVVSICEIKYSINEFIIDKSYDMKLRNKIGSFIKATNCKKSVQMVMVTTYGIKKNMYSGLINAEVVLDDLFEK